MAQCHQSHVQIMKHFHVIFKLLLPTWFVICAIPVLFYSLCSNLPQNQTECQNDSFSFKSIQMTFWIPTSFKSKWLLKILFIFPLPFPTHFPFSPVCLSYECFHRRVITNSANREILRGENTKSYIFSLRKKREDCILNCHVENSNFEQARVAWLMTESNCEREN